MTHEQALARIERLEAALRFSRMELIGMRNRAGADLWVADTATRGINRIDAALAPQEETR